MSWYQGLNHMPTSSPPVSSSTGSQVSSTSGIGSSASSTTNGANGLTNNNASNPPGVPSLGDQLSRTNLYIRGLAPHTTDKDLLQMCGRYVLTGMLTVDTRGYTGHKSGGECQEVSSFASVVSNDISSLCSSSLRPSNPFELTFIPCSLPSFSLFSCPSQEKGDRQETL